MIDSDWGIPVRLMTEAEAEDLPFTDEPEDPEILDDTVLNAQVEEEWKNGHPAYTTEEPDFEPVDTGTYPED